MIKSNFNKFPAIRIDDEEHRCFVGWGDIGLELRKAIGKRNGNKTLVVVECYQGSHNDALAKALVSALSPDLFIDTAYAMLPEEEIRKRTQADVTNDRIFGFMTSLDMIDFFDTGKLAAVKTSINELINGLILVVGPGASLLTPDDQRILIYADMPRWEIQLRMRHNEVNNLGIRNMDASIEEKYKRGYFVDWRVCDRLKKKLMPSWDYVLDSTNMDVVKMISGKAALKGLDQASRQPFSVVPYFDAGPWGGHWMKEVCDLDKSMINSAWCFNCIPEENSLLLQFEEATFEMPSINLVFYRPVPLLGQKVYNRFGDEFPIRFDFLDTMDGGNLSLQVHPLTEYIREQFGIEYTQDESYYIMDAGEDACVYLGLKDGVDGDQMIADLKRAESESSHFDDARYVEKWPAMKHDHFLIPGGTVHCSGKNSMVLEISATPYIFTFKLWDWGRLGLDGRPRPINIDHGANVIQWDRTTSWTENNLVNRIEKVSEGEGWTEEKTGLHDTEFIETRRHWFTGTVRHQTHDGVQVFNLVEGREAIVESPLQAFEPFVVHYAETFIVPAAVGEFTIRPHGESEGSTCATIKAYVRTNF